MASRAITLATNIVTALNANTFSLAFTAERAYEPDVVLTDLATLKVFVVPHAKAEKPIGRRPTNQAPVCEVGTVIEIGVLKHIGSPAPALVDPLTALVEEIGDYLKGHQVADAQWMALENDPIWYSNHLVDAGQFTSVLKLTYRGQA